MFGGCFSSEHGAEMASANRSPVTIYERDEPIVEPDGMQAWSPAEYLPSYCFPLHASRRFMVSFLI